MSIQCELCGQFFSVRCLELPRYCDVCQDWLEWKRHERKVRIFGEQEQHKENVEKP